MDAPVIPKFMLYGEGNVEIERAIQPHLAWRSWDELTAHDKAIALKELENNGWLKEYSDETVFTIEYLNTVFLRQCPGKVLHKIGPRLGRGVGYDSNDSDRRKAALADFKVIFLQANEALVLRMLSKFLETYIDWHYYRLAEQENKEQKRLENIEHAFGKFDKLSYCLNHIFEQFAINVFVTRAGLIPRQDSKITEQVYAPTLRILSNPQWQTVSEDLGRMFSDYQQRNYSEVITKAHRVVQRFLQILVGQEGKNAKGELGNLFKEAKQKGVIPGGRFADPMIEVFKSFMVSERATNSTAKPALKEATSSEALLMMNVVMVFLQHCLQDKQE